MCRIGRLLRQGLKLLCLTCEMGCVLFSNCVDVGVALLEEVEASCNRLIADDLHDLHNWYFVLHAQVAKDLVVIYEAAFMVALMDVKAANGTCIGSCLRNIQCWETDTATAVSASSHSSMILPSRGGLAWRWLSMARQGKARTLAL